jgi:hypothetical protein
MAVVHESWQLKVPEQDEEPLGTLLFANPSEMLHYVTRNWRQNFVTVDLRNKAVIEDFSIRPFFMLLSIDAPILRRFSRMHRWAANLLCYGGPYYCLVELPPWKTSFGNMTMPCMENRVMLSIRLRIPWRLPRPCTASAN